MPQELLSDKSISCFAIIQGIILDFSLSEKFLRKTKAILTYPLSVLIARESIALFQEKQCNNITMQQCYNTTLKHSDITIYIFINFKIDIFILQTINFGRNKFIYKF